MVRSWIRNSERIYSLLVRLYPKHYRDEYGEEMQFVFSESVKDTYKEHGEHGVTRLWMRMVWDTGRSLIIQHWETHAMKTKQTLINNKDSAAVVGGTIGILLIPLITMQFTTDVQWDVFDFVVMGALLLATGFGLVFVNRKFKNYRLPLFVMIVLGFLWLWAELAVGIFTNWGS